MNEVAQKAYKDFKAGMKYKDIAKKYDVSLSAVKSWATRYWKKEGCNLKAAKSQPRKKEVATRRRGGQPGNKNALGHGGTGPPGNKNAVKHGAYEHIYENALPEEERAIFNAIPDTADLDGEIKVLRLKLARLLCRNEIMTYDIYGTPLKRTITEEEREKGLLAVSAEIRKLVKAKKEIQLAEIKAGIEDQEIQEDDGFIEALNGTAEGDWSDEDT